MKLVAILGSLLLALEACSSTGPAPLLLSVATDRGQYLESDTVFARLSNLTDRQLSFNRCSVAIDVYGSSGWQPTSGDSGAPPCLSNLDLLEPGTSQTVAVHLGQAAAGGIFRVRFLTVFDTNDARVPEDQRSSNAFRVP